ncbi:MAG TPA: hypothetical protein VF773_08105 [Verrucomicrobiae bacterium]
MNTKHTQNTHTDRNVDLTSALGQRPNSLPPPVPATQPPPTVDAAAQWRIDFIIRKQRATAFFNQLNPTQQTTLCQWFDQLSIAEIHKRILAPPPEGWGLQISPTVLQRTRTLHFSAANDALADEMHDLLKDMQPVTALTNLPGVQRGIAQFLHQAAVSLARRDPQSKDLQALLANIQRLSALDFKRQQLELQREKLTYGRSF